MEEQNQNSVDLHPSSHPPSSESSRSESPDYIFDDLTPVLSLPPYPNRERDPPPPEYYEIMRFNASSYAWTFPQHQLQSAINAGDMSPLATATIVRRNTTYLSSNTNGVIAQSGGRRRSSVRENSEEFSAEERARIDRNLRRRMEAEVVVHQHCRPIIYHTNSVGRLASALQRWTDLLEVRDEDGTEEAAGRVSKRKKSEVEVPGWIKARIEERKSSKSRPKILSWFRKSRSYHL